MTLGAAIRQPENGETGFQAAFEFLEDGRDGVYVWFFRLPWGG
ncbi:hypothetical protein [Kingella oralis]